jgi:hypothetical protein
MMDDVELATANISKGIGALVLISVIREEMA